ncbi:MAG: hypothetical protein LBB53_03875 [Prevotellaceae bacterium]|jgi:hypothetical protein|nr:hypothetical protein [Prevotellaceae bacterium]
MKKLVLLSLIALFSGVLAAQTAKKVGFEISKGRIEQGYTLDFSADKSTKSISDAFQELIEKNYGLKSGKSNAAKGFTNYVNQTIQPVSPYPVSVYFKVESEKKEKVARLYFLVLDGGENKVHPDLLPALEPKIYEFLNGFPAILTDYENNLKLKDAQNLLEKQKKDLEKLNKEKAKLEKQLNDNATEISSKEKEIVNTDAEIIKLQGLLRK